ncbi:MAG: hypothetical protein JOZ71_04560, partial [Ktedonobacteraceae bacterium]|nr:hypothetical protein [Ktedonobacteraceae bacterium]
MYHPLIHMITVWATRRFSFPVLLVLVGLLFAGCSAPSFRQPTGYVFSNEVSLTYLTWNQSDDGHLSGQWRQVRFDPALLSATAQPDVATLGYTGTMQNQHVMLTLSPGGTLLVGQLSHNVLTLSATDNDGQVVTESWQSVTAQDEHALVAAFTASMRVRGALLILGRDMQFTPPFSDFSAADMNWQLYHASVYVAMLQARLASMQQDHSQVSRCQKAVDFAQVSP